MVSQRQKATVTSKHNRNREEIFCSLSRKLVIEGRLSKKLISEKRTEAVDFLCCWFSLWEDILLLYSSTVDDIPSPTLHLHSSSWGLRPFRSSSRYFFIVVKIGSPTWVPFGLINILSSLVFMDIYHSERMSKKNTRGNSWKSSFCFLVASSSFHHERFVVSRSIGHVITNMQVRKIKITFHWKRRHMTLYHSTLTKKTWKRETRRKR